MAKYVDGFVLVVPKGKEAEYEEMTRMGRDAWMKHGALQYFECRGDDLAPQALGPDKMRQFSEMAGANDQENVWFSFIVFESKAHRDEVNQKVMAEMDESYSDQVDFQMPNDMTKMAYGGFTAVVEG
ncbi:RNA signal recognition particle [Candidatus Saccharibacteria bacterium]|nr:RNA signal recognition particle [Candidatus Saccharibacteria bacterium]|tara:strand:- start:68 stop:448 length:381 start_codon:yes stop_codon:yes gene_type:complete